MKGLALACIRFYQASVSPFGMAACRFQPTCSHYGLEAYRKYGFLMATAKTVWRILRCNPWNHGPRHDPP